MDDATRDLAPNESGPYPPDSLDQRLSDLSRKVDQLEETLREVRGSFPPDEIRCRKLVVVAADDFERVVISGDDSASESAGDVRVFARNGDGSTSVDLFAIDATDEEPAQVGLALFDHGDASLLLEATSGERPRFWTI